MLTAALGTVLLIFLASVVLVVIARDTESRIAHDIGVALLAGSMLAGAVFVAEGFRADRAEVLENIRFVRQVALNSPPESQAPRGLPFRGLNLKGANLSGLVLDGADFSGANLAGARLDGTSLRNADFLLANLEGASLRFADLEDADLKYVVARSADFSRATLHGAILGGDFTDANFFTDRVTSTQFLDAVLTGATFLTSKNWSSVEFMIVCWDDSRPPAWPADLSTPTNHSNTGPSWTADEAERVLEVAFRDFTGAEAEVESLSGCG